MSVQTLQQKDTGHALGLAYLTDIVQGGGIQGIVAGDAIGVDNTDPLHPILSNLGVVSISAGTGISVDNTDPQQPIITATGGGGVLPTYINAGETQNWTLTPFANGATINTITYVSTYSDDVIVSFNTSFVFEGSGTTKDDDIQCYWEVSDNGAEAVNFDINHRQPYYTAGGNTSGLMSLTDNQPMQMIVGHTYTFRLIFSGVENDNYVITTANPVNVLISPATPYH